LILHDKTMTDIDSGKQRQGIQSIEVGAKLLRVLAARGRPMMLKDLGKAAGMSPAKAHRYLVSYIRAGLVEQDPYTGRYDLGAFSLELGLSSLARLDTVRLAGPILDQLCEDVNETVSLAVWGTYGPTIVRLVEPWGPITVTLRAGSVLPLTRSATGRAFAAFCNSAAVKKQLDSEIRELAKTSGISIAAAEAQIGPILAEIKNKGIGRASGSHTPGINGFAAPVFDFTGKMVASFTALGAVGHFDDAWDSPISIALKEAAELLSTRLGKPAAEEEVNAKGAK
jgi:DNA-binding IclR family transcriptional regulator